MNLYLLSQSKNRGKDTYDECVVVASSAVNAAYIHPSPDQGSWWSDPDYRNYTWVDPRDVKVTYIGRAARKLRRGVVSASFNAG